MAVLKYLPSIALNGVIKRSECIFLHKNVQFNRTIVMLNVLCTHSRRLKCFEKLKFSADFLSEQSNNFSDVVCMCGVFERYSNNLNSAFVGLFLFFMVCHIHYSNNSWLISLFSFRFVNSCKHTHIHYIQHVFLNGL